MNRRNFVKLAGSLIASIASSKATALTEQSNELAGSWGAIDKDEAFKPRPFSEYKVAGEIVLTDDANEPHQICRIWLYRVEGTADLYEGSDTARLTGTITTAKIYMNDGLALIVDLNDVDAEVKVDTHNITAGDLITFDSIKINKREAG
tara:strand:- start:66411 stop:66857 length:447 start_codon:yes stop_codon:yes gene_type:complete